MAKKKEVEAKPKERDQHHELGKIDYVKVENWRGEGEPNTVMIGIDLDAGCHQGYGGLHLPDASARANFLRMLRWTFGVDGNSDLKGQKCYVLRSFTGWNEPIIGLESVETGRSMTTNQFCALEGYKVENALVKRKESILSSIEHHKRRIADDERTLKNLEADYKEWD